MIRNFTPGNTIPFVGRTKELTDVTARLLSPECRLLTLTGLGGSGKTRLAVEAANTVASQFTNGAVVVRVQPLRRSSLLVPNIAQALGLTFYGENDMQDQLLEYLREKSLLLILDNFEHLLDGGVSVVEAILDTAPHVKIMVTSRAALSLQEEWLYPLKGMSTPPSVYVDSASLEEYEAVQFFLYHARRIQPDFDLLTEHESIVRICIMAAGLPLALELAASWLKGSSTAQIVHEMQTNLDFLSTTTRNIEERHRSMRAVFDHSWQLLGECDRLSFARLSVFLGGFDIDAADQVAGASFSCLANLVEQSLIQMDTPNRFYIHQMLRQYGMEKLAEYGEVDAVQRRHSTYFAGRMLRYETELKQPGQIKTMRAIEADFENIRLAWEWSAQNQHLENLHAMLNGLYLFGFLGRRHRETISIFQNTLNQAPADTALMGRLRARRWGFLHWWYQSDYQEALEGIETSLDIALNEDNTFEIAFSHLMASYAKISMQRYADALPHLEISRQLFESLNEPYYVSWVLHRLGYVHANLNHAVKDLEYTEQSLALARVTGDRFALVICLYNLGSVYVMNGEHIKAKHYATEALQFATESAHQCQTAHAFSLLALCAFAEGDYEASREYAEQAQTIIQDIITLVIQPYSLNLLILLACMREDYKEAMHLNELNKRHSTSTCDLQLEYWVMAALASGLGNRAEARTYIQKVMELADPNTPECALHYWLVPLVANLFAETDPKLALELLAWVDWDTDNHLEWVHHWPLFARLQTQLKRALDSNTYQAHWNKGRTFTLETIKRNLKHEFCISDGMTETQQHLTAREHEILRLMSTGMTNPQIADFLVIGAGTVKTHTLNIYRKLEVGNRTQAIVRAQELGLQIA